MVSLDVLYAPFLFLSYKVFVGSTIVIIRPLLDNERIAVASMPSPNYIGWGRSFISMDVTLQALQFSECRFASVGSRRSANFELYWTMRAATPMSNWNLIGWCERIHFRDDVFQTLRVSFNTFRYLCRWIEIYFLTTTNFVVTINCLNHFLMVGLGALYAPLLLDHIKFLLVAPSWCLDLYWTRRGWPRAHVIFKLYWVREGFHFDGRHATSVTI